MRRGIQGTILRMLLAFFAGAIAMLFWLVPGKVRLEDLLDSKKRCEMADFDQAADKVEEANELALFYAYKVKRYVEDKITR